MLKQLYALKTIGLKANQSKCVQQTFQLRFVEFPSHLTDQEMFTMWQFFAPLNHKYLGSTMKILETEEPFFRYKISFENNIPANELF